ncbi:MAG TPA: response regulator, partial [Geobacterales bacterium]|nr:response regulator [Geobacterales bacterium]
MRILIVEDDFVSRVLLKKLLGVLGDCDMAVNGREALAAFDLAWEEKRPYELICLDIMMPEMNGHEALKQIREREKELEVQGMEQEVKILMTTALDDPKNVMDAYYWGATE